MLLQYSFLDFPLYVNELSVARPVATSVTQVDLIGFSSYIEKDQVG